VAYDKNIFMKALGFVVLNKIFLNSILKPHFLPRDLLLQPVKMVSNLVGYFPMIILVKFGQNPLCSLGGEVSCSFPYSIQY